MALKITTDWHIGVKRNAGTTPGSAEKLGAYLHSALHDALFSDLKSAHIIAGDIFDRFTVDTADLIHTYTTLAKWLDISNEQLVLMRGNHDYQPRGASASSFDLLTHILSAQFPDQVVVVTEPTEWRQFIFIPHLPNNEILQLEIDKLRDVSRRIIIFHANLDNPWAAESQNSLNVSMDAANALVAQGNIVCFGHEHQPRTLNGGKIIVLGNVVPSSVSDCLGNDTKYHTLVDGLDVTRVPVLNVREVFCEMDWKELDETPAHMQFVRVTGDCTSNEAAGMISAVSKLRQKHSAFVITNSVKIEGIAQMEALTDLTQESLSRFDVMGALFEDMNEREQTTIKGLLA